MSSAPNLSRELIANAALAIADKDGFDQVSMRRLAQYLGVGTMSLYYYVKTKADLITLMDDALMATLIVPALPRDWKKALIAIASHTRDLFLRHPWALSSMQEVRPGDNAARHFEQCLRVLSKTTLTNQEKLTLLALIDDFVFGYALRESAKHDEADIEEGKRRLATGEFPYLAELFCDEALEVMPDRFMTGLEAIFDSVGKKRKR